MNNEIVKKWLPYIEADLDIAKISLTKQKSNHWTYLLIIWHCHQAVEKSLKMYTIAKNKELLPIHDLIRLIKHAEIDNEKDKIDFIYSLSKYYIIPRYPDYPLKKSTPQKEKKTAEYYCQKSKEFFIWIQKLLKTS
jgi:HEPN domain-containing protein